ncbi:MAG: HAD-IC family P-type ATPase [Candidatus Rokubacteria bacterium]|nr:HAD-IC family P-type ATPase [Candidatus Rokubacteria bacterium]
MKTGPATEFGRVAAGLVGPPPETECERGARRFGFLILEIVIFLVLFVFLVNALARCELLESFLFSVALAVGLTPELLPMIVSVTLASGAVHMAQKKVIVKQLAAIENFGSMDILCSDKTGTLTRGEITVDRHVNPRGEDDETVIRLAALNSVYQTGLKSPMDEAILRHEHPAVGRYARVDEIPFDFLRRRVSVVVEGGGERLLITKGAPEGILPVCTRLEQDGVTAPLDVAGRAQADDLFRSLSADGYRALAVAYRAGESLFRAGWFVESLATQTLIIFVIRTADRPWQSRPSRALAWGVGCCAVAGSALPFTPLAPWLGFTPLPPLFFAFLLAMVAGYLGLVEVVKRWFYRRYAT